MKKLNKHDKPARRPDGKVKKQPDPVPFYRCRTEPTVTPMTRVMRTKMAQLRRGLRGRYVWDRGVREFLAERGLSVDNQQQKDAHAVPTTGISAA